jgi:hypothetical protein
MTMINDDNKGLFGRKVAKISPPQWDINAPETVIGM